MLPVAIDLNGGDKGVAEILSGARQAAALGIPVLLLALRGAAEGMDFLRDISPNTTPRRYWAGIMPGYSPRARRTNRGWPVEFS